MTTLLQQTEIIKYTGVGNDIAPCAFNLIFQVEYKEFRKCLGIAFYDELKSDLITHDYENYKSGEIYTIGQKVGFQGAIYEALRNTSTPPSVKENWKLCDKFNKQCFNDLWCNFLANFLAWRVLREHQPYLESLVGETKTKERYDREMTAIDNSTSITFSNMVHWVNANNENGCFDKMKFIAVDCCGGCGCETEKCICSCEKSFDYRHKYSVY